MYRAGKVSVRVPELAELRRIEAEVKDARHAGAKRVEVKFPEEKVLLRKLDGKKFQEAVKRIFSARELAELRKLERQMEKMRHHHLRAEVSFPEVHPVPRRVNELLYDAPRKFFGKDEVRQLKLLEKEAMLLHREVSHIGGVKVQLVRPVAREVEEGLLRARPDLLVNEESELKVLATELALARHQERGRVIGSGPTSNMFLRPFIKKADPNISSLLAELTLNVIVPFRSRIKLDSESGMVKSEFCLFSSHILVNPSLLIKTSGVFTLKLITIYPSSFFV